MLTVDKILEFCTVLRTSGQIAEYCGLDKRSIYAPLNNLQRSKKIEKRGEHRAKMFITIRQAPVVTVDYENLVITHAHNPFGLRP